MVIGVTLHAVSVCVARSSIPHTVSQGVRYNVCDQSPRYSDWKA
jgi:hypothetical protein